MNGKRGARLFNSIMNEDIRMEALMPRARRNDLLAARNRCLVHRYYYYAKLLHLSYEAVLAELKKEFFIADETIPRIISQEIEIIREITLQKLTVKQLEKLYPQYSWKQKANELKIKMYQRQVYNSY
jgi:hypothetical protein